jgi:type I restriction enzyme S subunit
VEVKQGYKQTEVGVIPEDWVVKNIGEQIDLLTGFPFPSKGYSFSGVKLLRGSNIKRGVTDWSPEITKYWKGMYPELKQYLLDNGDIVIAMDGSLVGRSFARLSNADLPALLLQRVARVRSKKIDMGYLKEFICSDYFTKHCDSVKTVTAIPHISPNDINCFKIPIPPTLAEQTAIATALSDADALILSLERLAAKKRAIKQGAMQQLLNPKENWVMMKLGEILDTVQLGGNYPNSGTKSNHPLIKMGNLNRGKIDVTKLEFIKNDVFPSEKDRLHIGDVLFNTRNTLDLVGKVAIWEGELSEAYFNSNIMRLNFKQSYVASNYFMNFMLNTKALIDQLRGMATGTTSVAAINKRDLVNLNIPLPSLTEQNRIANILSDMDAEITTLETKLVKYKQIKQGMMRNLLTGRIRLV